MRSRPRAENFPGPLPYPRATNFSDDDDDSMRHIHDSLKNIMVGAATDPADVAEHTRRELGLSRQLKLMRRVPPHPSWGGSTGYAVSFRQEQLQRWHNGDPTIASKSSLQRWNLWLLPYHQTGNGPQSQLIGIEMVLLVTFVIAYPDAIIEEMAVFIYNNGGCIYNRPTISKRLKELEITRKKASTEAYQAQRADVQFRLERFFNCPHPLGICGL